MRRVLGGALDAALTHKLHADTYPQKRPAILDNALGQCRDHAVNGAQALGAIAKGADTGQNNMVGLAHMFGRAADQHIRLCVHLGGRMRKGFFGRA